ncbi:MAG: c-type cytochrome [Leptolyngbyaceae cyanobacterium SM1_4_3]|nr:c-type cytochrome [Leptolyngbyaceae cyanobacterium SM1_4_3]NJN90439.1 c-type cytochrome [Leptolyngbyaceae cyanobacterium SL_5_14]
MKKLLLAIGLAIALTLFSSVFPHSITLAADLANGAKVFSANCAACHAGGGNVVNRAKTLKQEALEQYEMASLEAIQQQVTNGKNAMPAFKGRLTDPQIEDVAAYVLDQAEKGW